MTYKWANAIFDKKIAVEKTGVPKYRNKERLQLDHHHARIPKRFIYVCWSTFFFLHKMDIAVLGKILNKKSFNLSQIYPYFVHIFAKTNEMKVGLTVIDRPRVDH